MLIVILLSYHRERDHKQYSKMLYVIIIAFLIALSGELIYSRILSSTELHLFRLSDLSEIVLAPFRSGRQVRIFESVIFINDLAKEIYMNARFLILDRLSSLYVYYVNALIVLFSVITILLDLLGVRDIHSGELRELLLLYLALFTGAVVHAMIYYVTYGALGTRPYMYFVLPLFPIVYMHLIDEFSKVFKYHRAMLMKLHIFVLVFFILISFISAVNTDVITGFVNGFTRSSNMVSIKTLPEAASLSALVDPSLTILTDYPRSQYVFRGLILHDIRGDVRPYLSKLKFLVELSTNNSSLIKGIYDNLKANYLLISSDNFDRIVYGDIAAYMAPPLNYSAINMLSQLSNKLYSSNSLSLIAKPYES